MHWLCNFWGFCWKKDLLRFWKGIKGEKSENKRVFVPGGDFMKVNYPSQDQAAEHHKPAKKVSSEEVADDFRKA